MDFENDSLSSSEGLNKYTCWELPPYTPPTTTTTKKPTYGTTTTTTKKPTFNPTTPTTTTTTPAPCTTEVGSFTNGYAKLRSNFINRLDKTSLKITLEFATVMQGEGLMLWQGSPVSYTKESYTNQETNVRGGVFQNVVFVKYIQCRQSIEYIF